VLEGYTPAEMVTLAFPLLLNGKVMRAVQAGRRSGRGLKFVVSGRGWRRKQRQRALKLEEERKDWHEQYPYLEWAVVDGLADDVIGFDIEMDEYADSWEEMKMLKGACGIHSSSISSSNPNAWDEWCEEFDSQKAAIRAHQASPSAGIEAVDNRVDDIVRKVASTPETVEGCQFQAFPEQGDLGAHPVTDGEVLDTPEVSSPGSTVSDPRSCIIASNPVPFQLPDGISAGGASECDASTRKSTDETPDDGTPPLANPDPALWRYVGGQQGAENCILMICSLSIVIAGGAGLLPQSS
jgi:hypothetical protein